MQEVVLFLLIVMIAVSVGFGVASLREQRFRYFVIGAGWAVTVLAVLTRVAITGGAHLGALLLLYTFPFLPVLLLARSRHLMRHPILSGILIPVVLLAALYITIVVMVSHGLIPP